MRRWWMRPIGNDLIAVLEYILAPWLLAIALTAGIFAVRRVMQRARPLPVSSTLKGFAKAFALEGGDTGSVARRSFICTEEPTNAVSVG